MPIQNSAADIVSSQRHVATAALQVMATSQSRRNNEFELLRACCGDGQEISLALRQEMQWDRVFQQAEYHRLLPALFTALRDRPEVPASIQSALRARYLRHCQRAMRFSAELAGILQHLEARGMPVIAQKGPTLAHFLYGDSAMREFGDLDLLVRPADVLRAVGVLTELGYKKKLQLSPRQEREYLRSGYEYVFGRGEEHNLIELQWNLLPRFYAVDVDTGQLFARSQHHEVDGCHVRMLGLEDQFLFLCLHAAKHQWAQLGMVRDIAAMARLDLDWELVLHEARRLGIVRIVLVSLVLANVLIGCDIPERVAGSKEVVAAERLVTQIIEQMKTMQEIPPESPAYFRFMLQVRERGWERVRFVWRLATTPGTGEWHTLQIPDVLFPLYVFVRAVRLARRVA